MPFVLKVDECEASSKWCWRGRCDLAGAEGHVLSLISVLRTRQKKLAVLPAPRQPFVLVSGWRQLRSRRG